MVRQFAFLLAASLLACICTACSSGKPEAQEEKSVEQQPAEPAPTVLDDQLKALEKAKQVEQTLQDEQKARDKAIDDASGG